MSIYFVKENILLISVLTKNTTIDISEMMRHSYVFRSYTLY
jgi:hypothetical protein